MAVTQLNSYSAGDINFTSMMETLDKTSKGKADITISNYDNDSASVVKVGSVFENNGSLFIVDSADITPTGYSGIAVSTTFYLYYDESGGTFIFSSTAPVWSDTLQGWYNGNDRAFFSMYKDSGGTLYQRKTKLLTYFPVPEFGAVGTITIAASSEWARSTEYLPGTTVSGNSLYYSTDITSVEGASISSLVVSTNYVEDTSWNSYGFTGTWELLTRVYQADITNRPHSYVIGLLQRIA